MSSRAKHMDIVSYRPVCQYIYVGKLRALEPHTPIAAMPTQENNKL